MIEISNYKKGELAMIIQIIKNVYMSNLKNPKLRVTTTTVHFCKTVQFER